MTVDSKFKIRLAKNEDFEEVYAIWLEGISSSFDTSALEKIVVYEKFRNNFLKRSGIFNYWIAVSEENEVAGWQSLNKCTVNPIKENHFAESSTYVKKEARKYGVGEFLLTYVTETAKASTLQYITAYVTAENTAIRAITSKLGFVEIGVLPSNSKTKQTTMKNKIFIIKPL